MTLAFTEHSNQGKDEQDVLARLRALVNSWIGVSRVS